jgi:hypothetical protein
VKKVAFCRQTNPIGFGILIRAVNGLKRVSNLALGRGPIGFRY